MARIVKPQLAGPQRQGGQPAYGRRGFLKRLTGCVAVAGLMSGCDVLFGLDDGNDDADAVDLGSGDVGVLNYAYALEQLEAAFYIQVVNNFYNGATDEEKRVLTDLRDHEIVHRDFLAAALGEMAIPGLEVDFSAVNFSSRNSVLGTARVFEDLGVSAYNGAGKLLTNPDYLLLAGKIVSVEARHAAAIRDLIQPNSAYFAGDDVVDENGLDLAREPGAVLSMADSYIVTPVTAANLPTS